MSDPHNEFKGKNVLIELTDTSALAKQYGLPIEKYVDILGECRQKLFDIRSRRPRPHLDDKVLSFACHKSVLICLEMLFDMFFLLLVMHTLTVQVLAR